MVFEETDFSKEVYIFALMDDCDCGGDCSARVVSALRICRRDDADKVAKLIDDYHEQISAFNRIDATGRGDRFIEHEKLYAKYILNGMMPEDARKRAYIEIPNVFSITALERGVVREAFRERLNELAPEIDYEEIEGDIP